MDPSEVNFDRFTRIARLGVFSDPSYSPTSFQQDALKIAEKTSDFMEVAVDCDSEELLLEPTHSGDSEFLLLSKPEAHVLARVTLDAHDEGFNEAFDAASDALSEAAP